MLFHSPLYLFCAIPLIAILLSQSVPFLLAEEASPPSSSKELVVFGTAGEKVPRSLEFIPSKNAVVTVSMQGTAAWWNLDAGSTFRTNTFPGSSKRINKAAFQSLAWTDAGLRLATFSSDQKVTVWDVEKGKRLLQHKGDYLGPGTGPYAAFSPDGRYLFSWSALDGKDELKIIREELASGQIVSTYTFKHLAPQSSHLTPLQLIVSSDGTMLAAGCGADGVDMGQRYSAYWVSVMDSLTGKEIGRLNTRPFNDIRWHPVYDYILSAAVDRIVVLDAPSGLTIGTHKLSQLPVRLLVSRDGALLGIVTKANEVIVLDFYTGEQVARYKVDGEIRDGCFAPDGRRVVLALMDGRLAVVTLWSGPRSPREEPVDAESHWDALGSNKFGIMHEAVEFLIQNPDVSLPLLKRKIHEGVRSDVPAIVQELASDDYAVREAAQTKAVKWSFLFMPLALQLSSEKDAELQFRLRQIARATTGAEAHLREPSSLALLRTIRVLEGISSDQSQLLLSAMAEMPSTSILGIESRRAISRLNRLQSKGP